MVASLPTVPPARPVFPLWYHRALAWWSHRRKRVPDEIDIALAAVSFAVFTLPVTLGARGGHGSTWAVTLLGALAACPLLVRRRWPLSALACVTAVECLASLAGVRFTLFVSNAFPALAIAVLTVADRCPRRTCLRALGLVVFVTTVAAGIALHLHPEQDQNTPLPVALLATPAWLIGDAIRTRRGYRSRLAAEARRQAAERDRRIRAEERLRLSRDVHDVMSHTLSMIAVRSGVARLLLDEQPAEAKDALTVIEDASRSALDELRRVLTATRDVVTDGSDDDSGTEPTLADLGRLVGTLRHHGLELAYRTTGATRHYPPVLETSAYRIVQEALTNVVKHAAATHAWVEVHHEPRKLVVSVVDDGRAHQDGHPRVGADTGSRLGLVGMRERAALFDGTLTAGPRPEGGFAVVASFPTDRHVDAG